jgi:hypothetical protein
MRVASGAPSFTLAARSSAVLTALLRRADAHEVHLGPGRRSRVGGEGEPPGGQRLLEELGEPRLVEGGLSAPKCCDLGLDHVDANDLMAELGHAGGVDCPEIAASED